MINSDETRELIKLSIIIGKIVSKGTGRTDSQKHLEDKLGDIILDEKMTIEEKNYAFFVEIAAERQKILQSFGGSNSRLATRLADICDKNLGMVLNKDSYAPKPDGLIAKFFKSAQNTLKTIFEFDSSTKEHSGGATNSDRVKDINGKSHQLKPSILDNPSLMRKMKAGYTDRENFGEVIAARISQRLMGLDSGKVPEVSLVYDPIKKRMSIASKYIEGTNGNLNAEVGVKPGGKHVVFVSANKKPLQNGERSIDILSAELKKDLARAIVLSAVVGDHDINPGNMIVATDANGKERMCRIDFGHAFNDLLNASEFNGGGVRNKNNQILDFFNRAEVAGIGGAESKLWRNYPGFVPSQEIVDALNEMAGDFENKAKAGVEDAKKEFQRAFDKMKNAGDKEGIQHMKDSLNAICENISGKKIPDNPNSTAFLDDAFKAIESFTLANGKKLNQVANIMQFQLDIDKALIEGAPVDNKRLGSQKGDTLTWVKTGPEPAFVGTFSEYLFHRSKQLKLEHNPQTIQTNYDKIFKADSNLSKPPQNRTEEYRLKMFGGREPKRSAEPTKEIETTHKPR